MIGPYVDLHASTEFEELEPNTPVRSLYCIHDLDTQALGRTLGSMRERGLGV